MMCIMYLIKLIIELLLAAEMVCEDLPKDVCAFSVSSSGKRCLLETEKGVNGEIEYQCRTSEVVVERMAEYIETDQCVEACGADRNSVGISSDAFFEPQFTGKLCSPACYQKCPNIVDLFFNLAAGEGKICLFNIPNDAILLHHHHTLFVQFNLFKKLLPNTNIKSLKKNSFYKYKAILWDTYMVLNCFNWDQNIKVNFCNFYNCIAIVITTISVIFICNFSQY